ncbi:MAG TPA: quinoprotein dehydrogenase-associated SoxYZ-like carrier [Hyphomicrobium sp.]|nr:quinoprotein dehydrogenase-associated SoxYZ-like carrier [Hyphomicrobium sp.]
MISLARFGALFAALMLAFAPATPARADAGDPWPGIAKDLFGGRTIEDTAQIVLDAPYRAEDAGVVPISVKLPAELAGKVSKLTLVIDKNPMPIVATFTFGSAAGTGDREISTRVRFDMYSNLRAIAETADGKLLMVSRFVKAAGGCSAPALKDADQALASLGKMQVKMFGDEQSKGSSTSMKQAQLMIRHPNYSGMQMNQLTGYYIPAKYVQEIEVKRGGELVFKIDAGISLSEDPNIRFSYGAGAAGDGIEVTAKDSDGNVFTGHASPKSS